MKIRTDFITNSSSSAFVIIGTKLTNDTVNYDEMWRLLDQKDLRYFSEEKVIGRVIANLDYDSWISVTKSFSSLKTTFEEVKNVLKELGVDEEVCLIADMFST